VSSGTRRRADELETPPEESTTLIKEADPELEKLLDEEEEIARRTRQSHEAPHFRADED
jgi:small subunit ribosomal protein S3